MLVLCALSLAACASNSASSPYKLYPGPVRPAAELAIVKPFESRDLIVDGIMVGRDDWSEVLLLPGRHQIEEYGNRGGADAQAGTALEADLAAGNTYVFHHTGKGGQVWLWIEDGGDRSVVAGDKMP